MAPTLCPASAWWVPTSRWPKAVAPAARTARASPSASACPPSSFPVSRSGAPRSAELGTFRVTVEIGDPAATAWRPVEMLVDTGATLSWVPASVLRDLRVEPDREHRFVLADGTVTERGVAEAP